MILNNKFELGQMVYCKTDEEQGKKQITGIKITGPTDVLIYTCSVNGLEDNFYEYELTDEIDLSMKLGFQQKQE